MAKADKKKNGAEDSGSSEAGGDAVELTLEQKIELFDRKSSKHLWIVVGLLPLVILLFVVGVIGLKSTFTSASALVVAVPENKFDLYMEKIKEARARAEQQYAERLGKMDTTTINQLSEKFSMVYQMSLESEAAYGSMLSVYQQGTTEVAKSIEGSEEWFFFHSGELKSLKGRNTAREWRLKQHFKTK